MAICRFERAPAEFSANVVLLTSQSGGGGGGGFGEKLIRVWGRQKKTKKRLKTCK